MFHNVRAVRSGGPGTCLQVSDFLYKVKTLIIYSPPLWTADVIGFMI